MDRALVQSVMRWRGGRWSVEVPLYYCYWLIIHGLLILVSYFQNDFIVLGLVDGKVTLLANAGSTPLTLQTNKQFNDGQWHFVTIHVDGILWVFLVLMCLVSKPHPCWPLSCVAPSLFSDSRGQCVISIFLDFILTLMMMTCLINFKTRCLDIFRQHRICTLEVFQLAT